MKINFRKIVKASIAGLLAGLSFMVIIPAFLVFLNISFNYFQLENSILFYTGVFFIIVPAIHFWYCTGLFSFFGNGTPAPIEPPEKLVVEGIYKYTRNPMYLCYFLIILGEFLVLGYILLLYYFFFIVVFINIYIIFFEEPVLEKRFKEDYNNYKDRVPRWFLK